MTPRSTSRRMVLWLSAHPLLYQLLALTSTSDALPTTQDQEHFPARFPELPPPTHLRVVLQLAAVTTTLGPNMVLNVIAETHWEALQQRLSPQPGMSYFTLA